MWAQEEEAGRELISQCFPVPLFKACFGKNPEYFFSKVMRVQQLVSFSSEQSAMGPAILEIGLAHLAEA